MGILRDIKDGIRWLRDPGGGGMIWRDIKGGISVTVRVGEALEVWKGEDDRGGAEPLVFRGCFRGDIDGVGEVFGPGSVFRGLGSVVGGVSDLGRALRRFGEGGEEGGE